MRIAVPVQGDMIFPHFGQAGTFKIYFAENGLVLQAIPMASGVSGHEATVAFLKSAGVQLVICGGIGGGAIKALDDAGIMVMGGIVGKADEKIGEFLAGKLRYIPAEKAVGHGCHHHHGDSGCDDCHHHENGECTAENCEDCEHHENETER